MLDKQKFHVELSANRKVTETREVKGGPGANRWGGDIGRSGLLRGKAADCVSKRGVADDALSLLAAPGGDVRWKIAYQEAS